jgi:mannose-6-phosphate isomerase
MSLEPRKIKTIQAIAGIQLLTNRDSLIFKKTPNLVRLSESTKPTRDAALATGKFFCATKSAIYNPPNLKTAIRNKLTRCGERSATKASPGGTPLIFKPIFMERIWGGRRLESKFGKKLPPRKLIGESWEIVDRSEAQSTVRNGPLRGKTLHELWTQYRDEIFGNVPDAPRFPLLLKLLDAHDKLSLQVHPPETVASRLGGEPKTEFWYVAAADPDAELYLGFRKPITRDQFEKALHDETAADHIHKIRVKPGDAAFLPAGRFHGLGAGNLLIEVQQNSDTTYRVFDWNRVDDTGKQRQLHINQALESIDFDDVRPRLLQPEGELLVRQNLFDIQKWNLDSPREITPRGQFAIACCLSGSVRCVDVDLAPGEFFLVQAQLKDRQLNPKTEGTTLLRVTIPCRND